MNLCEEKRTLLPVTLVLVASEDSLLCILHSLQSSSSLRAANCQSPHRRPGRPLLKKEKIASRVQYFLGLLCLLFTKDVFLFCCSDEENKETNHQQQQNRN